MDAAGIAAILTALAALITAIGGVALGLRAQRKGTSEEALMKIMELQAEMLRNRRDRP